MKKWVVSVLTVWHLLGREAGVVHHHHHSRLLVLRGGTELR